jgi:mannose-1-phosphate guanylyltransferase
MTSSTVKAFLLSAGLGTRLRPLTETTPKILLSINGRPLLDIWLEHLKDHGIHEVMINTHWRNEIVEAFLQNRQNDSIRVLTYHEPTLLGSAGTLLANASWVADGNPFFILYGDNLTCVNLTKMLAFHQQHKFPFTLGVFRASKPIQCGIAQIDENDIVTDFIEKPERPKSNLAAAGIYVADHSIFQFFPQQSAHENSKGKMKAYMIESFLMDIGTPESYEQAQNLWKEIN